MIVILDGVVRVSLMEKVNLNMALKEINVPMLALGQECQAETEGAARMPLWLDGRK